jgi:hypothetical protein
MQRSTAEFDAYINAIHEDTNRRIAENAARVAEMMKGPERVIVMYPNTASGPVRAFGQITSSVEANQELAMFAAIENSGIIRNPRISPALVQALVHKTIHSPNGIDRVKARAEIFKVIRKSEEEYQTQALFAAIRNSGATIKPALLHKAIHNPNPAARKKAREAIFKAIRKHARRN